jgi:hypothetical protein
LTQYQGSNGHSATSDVFVDVCDFAALTSSTRLECGIHMVLMNLQDIGQTSIKVAQRECRATAVQVWGLNPAGLSVLRTG